MTGAEHYAEAERLLSEAGDIHVAEELGDPLAVALTLRANVHATLALAAAHADFVRVGMFTIAQIFDGEFTGDEGYGR